jgi:hypothetical protein
VPHQDPNHSGQRFRTWLARAVLELKDEAHFTAEEVAAPVGGIDKIRRFERGESLPRNIDQVISSYAKLAGVPDPREIYKRALELWYAEGTRPEVSANGDGATDGMAFEQEIEPPVVAQDEDGPVRKTTSKRTRRASP